MPRTVESIVSCHQAATALRAAGKPIWGSRINIKSILHEDQENESKEHVSAISVRIAAALRAQVPASYFDFSSNDFDCDLLEAVESLESCTVEALTQDEANGCEAVDMFNDWLEVIYDWADANRVWIG